MKNVSIIVCCYNSALKLPKTLEHLAQQKVSADLSYEIIVVDNASTDNTAEFAISYWATLNTQVSLRVVREETPGLIYARICGVKAAKNELLIFCDDDNWLRDDYVQNAVDIMNADSTIGALGGQSVLSPSIEAPDWWEKHQGSFAVGKQMSHSGYADERGFLYGAGLVTRKSLAEKVFDLRYPFLLVGRKGDICLSGEDGEYCQRIMLMGLHLYYNEKLFYWHDISSSRLCREYLYQLLKSFEPGGVIIEKYCYIRRYYNQNSIQKLLILMKRLFLYIFAQKYNRDRKRYLLHMQACVCGCNIVYDSDIVNILGWIKFSR